MKTTMRHTRKALSILVVLVFTLGIGLSTAFSGEIPKEAWGFGELKVQPVQTWNEVKGGTGKTKSYGKKSLGAIGDTVGNRFTFSFGATKDANGKVQGQIFIRDHTLNMTVSGEVAINTPS